MKKSLILSTILLGLLSMSIANAWRIVDATGVDGAAPAVANVRTSSIEGASNTLKCISDSDCAFIYSNCLYLKHDDQTATRFPEGAWIRGTDGVEVSFRGGTPVKYDNITKVKATELEKLSSDNLAKIKPLFGSTQDTDGFLSASNPCNKN